MFENCNTIQELNAARIGLLKSDKSHIEINRAFNARRKEILSSNKTFKRLTKITPTPTTPMIYNGCHYMGSSTVPNTIIVTNGGFYA